jgi:PPM family protein phosphatase
MDKRKLSLDVAALTHLGKTRPSNEDAVAIGKELIAADIFGPKRFTLSGSHCVLMIADGMGGHSHGALASKTALESLIRSSDTATDEMKWENALHAANDAIYECMAQTRAARGMGTTIVGSVLSGAGVVHFNVGDSRLYRHSSSGLVRLSHDDVPIGSNGPGPRRSSHLITQSLGGRIAKTRIRPHLGSTGPLTIGETLLLCSDGLTDMVGEDEVASVIDAAKGVEECACGLLGLALSNGGRDNISIVVARILSV